MALLKNTIYKFKNLDFKIKLSIIILVLIVSWILSGVFSPQVKLENSKKRGGGEITFLTKKINSSEVFKVISGYGRIDRGQIDIFSELNSHVVKVLAKDGASVKKGQKIIRLLNGVLIPSPISGVLDTIHVKAGEIVFNGQTKLFSIISNTKLDAILNVSALEARFLKSGQVAKIITDNANFKGRVYFISKISDKSTNTFEVKIKIAQNKFDLFQDETVRVEINTVKTKGIFVPTSALSITPKNDIVVTTINEEGVVLKMPVEILHNTNSGVWVSGNFESSNIVVIRGADFALEGEKVKYKIENIT